MGEITVSFDRFFNEGLSAADVVRVMSDQPESVVEEAFDMAAHLDDYDWVTYACELIGFSKEDVGAIHVYYNHEKAQIVLRVLLMDDWLPEYEIDIDEFWDGRAPWPDRLEK